MKGRLLLLTGGILFAVIVAEIVLRAAGITYPLFYMRDYHVGATLRPGATGWWLTEGRAFVSINSDGLRDREHSSAKPPGAFRIAVLGDSYAEALQLPAEDSFWAVMERELRSCSALAGRVPEAINFGVSGYGTAQQLLTLRHRAWKYEPDAVVLTVTTGNDIRNNLRELEGDPDRPYFVYDGEKLVLDNSFRSHGHFPTTLRGKLIVAAYALSDHSRLLQLVKNAVDRLRSPPQWYEDGYRGGEEAGLNEKVYLEPRDRPWREAWLITEGLLKLMGREVREKGADLLVVTLSNGVEVNPDPAYRRAYATRVGASDLLYPERRIGGVCKDAGIPFLALSESLRRFAEEEGVYLHGFGDGIGAGHWNADGHRIGGEAIARRLCAVLEEKRAGRP